MDRAAIHFHWYRHIPDMALVVRLYPAQLSGFTESVIYWLGIPYDYMGNEAVDTWPWSPLIHGVHYP